MSGWHPDNCLKDTQPEHEHDEAPRQPGQFEDENLPPPEPQTHGFEPVGTKTGAKASESAVALRVVRGWLHATNHSIIILMGIPSLVCATV
jgi:hypothetical protein